MSNNKIKPLRYKLVGGCESIGLLPSLIKVHN
jgi:hypothetical protein